MAKETWNTVSDEVQFKFEADGDAFTGILNELDMKGSIPQAHLTGTSQHAGAEYFINCGHDLLRKLRKVPVGSEVRIVRTGELDTGQASPMMTFSVEHRAA